MKLGGWIPLRSTWMMERYVLGLEFSRVHLTIRYFGNASLRGAGYFLKSKVLGYVRIQHAACHAFQLLKIKAEKYIQLTQCVVENLRYRNVQFIVLAFSLSRVIALALYNV